jgi:excisionase family DNA binding protein
MNTDNDKWLTTQEAMELTGYNPEQIRRLARNGKIKTKKWGTAWMIDKMSLMEYMTLKGHGPQKKRKNPKM